MKSTLVILMLTAFATSVFAIEQITAKESAAPAAAECSSCEAACSSSEAACSSCEAACASCDATCGGEKSCCQQSKAAATGDAATVSAKIASTAATTTCCGEESDCCSGSTCTKPAASATLAATATASACGAQSKCCSECGCSKQATTAATNPSAPGATAQWTATTTEFAAVVADAATADSPCCGDCQCPHACAEAGCGASATATAAELERTGVDPYRIECPDALTIYLPALQTKCAEMQNELTARGILSEVQLPFVGKTIRQTVQPDGNIAIEDIGTVYISGMTIEEARLAILKKAFEANPQATRANFGVFVEVSSKNSKQAYIILEGSECGDNVIQVPVAEKTTVGSALKNCGGPQPTGFASATIWIARPACSGIGCETKLPVTWNCEAGQPTCETNHALLPGDRLFVRMETKDSLPVPPPPVASIEFPVMPHPIHYYQPFVPAEPQPEMTIAFDLPAHPPVMRYSAIPVAAPSPFSPQPSVIQASPSSIPEPGYAPIALPQQTPTQPISEKSTTCAESASWAHDGKRVEFEIAVYEDRTGSFAEFPKIRDGLLMVSDSDSTLSAVRIMEKQKLVKRLAAPRLKCALGEGATLCIESNCSNCEAENSKAKTDSLTMNVTANGAAPGIDGMTMYIETATQITRGDQVCGTTIGYRIEEGQTAILKTRPECRPASDDGDEPVYVVVTPKLVR